MQPAVELAKAVANTEFVPKSLRGNPAAITAAILYGDEVGLAPMQALAKIAVIEGRPTLAAEAMRALILAAGHDLWIEDATATRVTLAGKRRDSDQTSRVTWTMDDARRAKLAGRPAWNLYPRQMLLARATAELARGVFADAIGGLSATEELEDVDQAPGAEDRPAELSTKRRRRAAVATVTAPVEPAITPEAGVPTPPLPGEPAPDESERAPSAPDAPEGEPEGNQASEVPEGVTDRMSDAQRRKLMALYGEVDIKTPEGRHAFATFALQRQVESSADLTSDEASRLIDLLENRLGRGD
jgi:hypothetical protein